MQKNGTLKKIILDKDEIAVRIANVADCIIRDFSGETIKKIGFLGIQANGVPLAARIVAEIEKKTGFKPSSGSIDISMYRDDLGTRKEFFFKIHETSIPFDIEEGTLILVDDVLHTGRTIRAALDAITDYGRPSLIRLAVLIDRGGREFPIQPDYTGKKCTAGEKDKIVVEWSGADVGENAYLIRK